jgi:hypothetical protein
MNRILVPSLLSAALLATALPALAQESASPATAEAAQPAEAEAAQPAEAEVGQPADSATSEEASASDFTARVKRIKIKKRRSGSGFRVHMVTNDTGNGDAATIASAKIEVSLLSDGTSSSASLPDSTVTSHFKTASIDFGWATPPDGEYAVLTALLNADGEAIGELQEFVLTVAGEEVQVTATVDVEFEPSVEELGFAVNDCGNGKLRASVTGEGAGQVASVEFFWLDGFGGPAPDSLVQDGSRIRTVAKLGESNIDLGELGLALAELAEEPVRINVQVLDTADTVIGTATVEATAKYGDILIDGVPLEFD